MAFALHRAAPAILASAATVVDRHAVPGPSPTSTPRPVSARSWRSASAVTFLVMVTLLPALLVICGRWVFWPKRPAFGSPEPTGTGFWSRVGDRIAPRPRRVWVVTAGAAACSPASGCSGWTLRAVDRGDLHQEVRLDPGSEAAGRPRPVGHLQHRAGGHQHRPGRRRPGGDGGRRRAGRADTEPQRDRRRPVLLRGDRSVRTSRPPTAFEIVEATRDAVHAVDGADALVGGGSAFYLDTKIASERDNKVIIPIVLRGGVRDPDAPAPGS